MWFEWFICAILFYFECLPWLVGPALSDTVRVGPLGSQVANCGSQMVDEEVHKVKDEVMDMVGDVMNMAKEVATITKDTLAGREADNMVKEVAHPKLLGVKAYLSVCIF